jgi:hypothetical protein
MGYSRVPVCHVSLSPWLKEYNMAVTKLKIILSHDLPILVEKDHGPSVIKIKAYFVQPKFYKGLTRLSFYDLLFALLETFL